MKILFVTATRIGDAVLSTGLLRHLIERYPGAAFTIAAGPLAAPLFAEVPGLERLIAVEKKARGLHWLSLYGQVAATRWDLAVDLRGSALAYLLWARQRRVMGKGSPEEHRVHQLARLFDLEPPPAPMLWLGAQHRDAANRLVPPGAPVLVVGPAANWQGKEWRPARFAELALRLTAPTGLLSGARIVVMAAAHERAQAAPVIAALPRERVVDLVGKLDLLTAAAILHNAALFVGNDTGLMHVAAAAGAPTLGLFGPSNVKEYAPWGPRAAYVQTATPYLQLFQPGWDRFTTDSMMDSLSVDMAEEGARSLLQRLKGEAA
ncbi:MAG TPA: glycosyltransferase family 9 protein, partial [Stellaceae bacterium]|jgi:heptosyltransferase III|nr:glycosyltransferase family 9 protein [Stellaceae bacterium]